MGSPNFTVNNPAKDAHATLSPSSFKKIANCPGSVYLSRGIPDEKTTYSSEGDVYHKYVEQFSYLLDTWNADKHKDVLSAVAPNKERLPITQYRLSTEYEMAQHVCNALDMRRALEDFLCAERISHVRPKRYVEQRVILSDYVWGTLDYGLAVKRDKGWEGVVLDEKYGKGVPVRFDEFVYKNTLFNYQLALYAIGFYNHLKKTEGIELTYMYMYIHQPRVGKEPWEAQHCDMSLLLDWYEDVVKPAEAKAITCYQSIEKPSDDKFLAGNWCKTGFCKARAICPVYKEYAELALAVDVGLDSLPLPAPETVPLKTLVTVLKHKAVLTDYLKEVENYLHAEASRGVDIPGMTLQKKYGQTMWRSDLAEWQIAQKLQELDIDDPYRQKLISITEAKKLVHKEEKKEIEKLTEKPLRGEELVFVSSEDSVVEIDSV